MAATTVPDCGLLSIRNAWPPESILPQLCIVQSSVWSIRPFNLTGHANKTQSFGVVHIGLAKCVSNLMETCELLIRKYDACCFDGVPALAQGDPISRLQSCLVITQ